MKIPNQGEKGHLFILLVTPQHLSGPSQAAGLLWTLAAFPWDDTGSSLISYSACVSMLCFNTHYLCISSHPALNDYIQQSHQVEFTETADTNFTDLFFLQSTLQTFFLHPSLDTQECGHTGSNSCSCTWIIMFSSLRDFLHITSFQEKKKCVLAQYLRA